MTQFYLPLLMAHVALAILSPVLFSLRAARAVQGEDPAAGLLRVAPHAIDTLLLLAGLALAFTIGQYPFVQGWLTAKVLAVVLYILVGHVAVRRARTRRGRIAGWVLALLLIGYVYAVAFTRSATLTI